MGNNARTAIVCIKIESPMLTSLLLYLLYKLYSTNPAIKGLRTSWSFIFNSYIEIDLLIAYNARTAVIRARMDNLRLALLLLTLLYKLNVTNLAIKSLSPCGPLLSNSNLLMDVFISYNARTIAVRLSIRSIRLTALLFHLLYKLYATNRASKVLSVFSSLFLQLWH